MRKSTSRLLSALLVLCMVLALLPGMALAADTSGKCGDNVTWTLSKGTLTIEGTGAMDNYEFDESEYTSTAPWFAQQDSFASVIIKDGVTSIGDAAFASMSEWGMLVRVTIPDSVTYIGEKAFFVCDSMRNVYYTGSKAQWQQIEICAYEYNPLDNTNEISATIHYNYDASSTRDASGSFGNKLTWAYSRGTLTISGKGNMDNYHVIFGGNETENPVVLTPWWDYSDQIQTVIINSGATDIGEYVFATCINLIGVAIPDSVTSIGEFAFYACKSLTDVYYAGSESQWKQIKGVEYAEFPSTVTIHYNSTGPDSPSTPSTPSTPSIPSTGTAYPSTQTVDIDGTKVEFQMYALRDANGGETNYIKVRDLALAMSTTKAPFDVLWDGVINLVPGSVYKATGTENSTPFSGKRTYKAATDATNVDGEPSDLSAFILTDDNGGDYTYYQLRDLGRNLGFNVSWSQERGVFIESDKAYSESD